MLEQFIPYEQALKLKELGFDEECLGYYNRDNLNSPELIYNPNHLKDSEDFNTNNQKDCEIYAGGILAPLWQQAFNFLLWKLKHLSIDIEYSTAGYKLIVEQETVTQYHTKEECLNKLIELAEDELD